MVVNAGYYLVAAEYFKVKADYAPYYKNALLYLACIDEKKELSEQDMRQRAHDLCIAALLGETIYNFGELVSHQMRTLEIADQVAVTSYFTDTHRIRVGMDQEPHLCIQRWRYWQIRLTRQQL